MIKFTNLIPNAKLKTELDHAYNRVVYSGQFIGGQEVEAFETEWAEYCEAKYCVSTSSGQHALELLLRACGIGYNRDERVIVPGWTAVATWQAVLNVGASIWPVDVDWDTMLMGPKISLPEDTVTIMPVHLYGYQAEIADHNVPIINDACQAHGLRRLGTAAFSFYPTKNLGCYGDGGAIVTDDEGLADECRRLRQSNRLDPLQAVFLQVKLKYLDGINRMRQYNAAIYNDYLSDRVIKPPTIGVFHQYVIRTAHRDKLKAELLKRGVETMIHYPIPPHRLLGLDFDLPVADRLSKNVLSLPITCHPNEAEQVALAVNEVMREVS